MEEEFKLIRRPEETAKALIEENFRIERYEAVQQRRRERLETFKKYNVAALINAENKLIEFGEEVLALLKKHYGNDDEQ